MRVAAIDCGTNSVRLLVAQEGAHGGLTDLERRLILTRLGQGVDSLETWLESPGLASLSHILEGMERALNEVARAEVA